MGKSKIIQSEYHSESPCHSSGKQCIASVPDPGRLDESVTHGPLPGITFEVTNYVTGGNVTNFYWLPDGERIHYTITATGSGSWVGFPGTGGSCVGGAGASIGVDIWAHYK